MPGMSGCFLITPGRPANARPSLKLMLEYSTSTRTPSSSRSASVTESSRVASGPPSPLVTIHARMAQAYAARADEGGSAEEDRGFVVAFLRHGLPISECSLEGNRRHLSTLQRDHLPPLLVAGQVEHGHAQPGGEHPVVRRRGSPALDVAKGCRPGLNTGALLNDRGQLLSDAAQTGSTKSIESSFVVGVVHGVEGEPFRDDDQRGTASIVRAGHPADDLVHRRLLLGDQDGVGARSHTGVQRDPADVTAHDFRDHAAPVGIARRAQAVHGVGGDLHGGVEAEGVVGGRDVVVDGLGNAHDLEAFIRQPLRRSEGAFASDGDDRLDIVALDHLADSIRSAVALERVGARGPENRSTLLADALHLVTAEGQQILFDDSAPSALEADELLTVELVAFEYSTADDRIQSRCVSTTGQDSDSHMTHSGGGRVAWATRPLILGQARPCMARERRDRESMITASSSTAPVTMYRTEESRLSSVRPLAID